MTKLVAIAIALITISSAVPSVAQKITSDPNAGSLSAKSSAAEKSAPDLNQKVTYTSIDKRLAAVLQEISDRTGVDIQAGSGPKNWQVRDLPLIVCAREIPLGRLLRCIADATHLAFTSATVSGTKRYYIWRTPKREQQLADYFKTEEDQAHERAKVQWDSWLKLNSTSDSQLAVDTKDPIVSQNLSSARSFAKVIAALPGGTREKVFSGIPVLFKVKTASSALASALKDYYQQAWQLRHQDDSTVSSAADNQLTETQLNSLELKIRCDNLALSFSVSTGISDCFGMNPAADDAAQLLGSYNDLTPSPDPPQTEYAPGMRVLDLDNTSGLGIEKKIKIALPKEASEHTFASFIEALSKASGFTIICEDFFTHKPWYSLEEISGSDDTTLKSALESIEDIVPLQWHIDPARKILVGSSRLWWEDHASLVPASVVDNLLCKIKGDGVTIDDVAALTLLSDEQQENWIFDHKSLFRYDLLELYQPFWRLYASLSADDKALAKSGGVPLSHLDRAAVMDAFLYIKEVSEGEGAEGLSDSTKTIELLFPGIEDRVQEWAAQNYPQLLHNESEDTPFVDFDEVFAALLNAFPEVKSALEIPTDPTQILSLKLKLNKIPTADAAASVLPQNLKPAQYAMTIEGNGVKMAAGSIDLQLPLFSEKRRAELIKQTQRTEKSATPAPK